MRFAKEMHDAYKFLREKGHDVFLPEFVIEFVEGKLDWEMGSLNSEEGAEKKKEHNLIYKHYQKIKESDAILIINSEKNNIKNYIGANTLIEMGFAHVLNKKIYLLNGLPEFEYLLAEVKAMGPIILDGKLEKIE